MQIKIFPSGLNCVELSNAVRFFILSTIMEIQLDFERQVSDVFSLNTQKPSAGLRISMTRVVCFLESCT